MRFRYFDSQGEEIELSSIDTLKFRIGTGAVTPETLLFDAAVGRWAPAADHQVFRFLIDEDQTLLPDSSRAMLEAADAAAEDEAAEGNVPGLEGKRTRGVGSPASPSGSRAPRERTRSRSVSVPDLELPMTPVRRPRRGGGTSRLGGRHGLRRATLAAGGVIALASVAVLARFLDTHGEALASAGAETDPVGEASAAPPSASSRAIVAMKPPATPLRTVASQGTGEVGRMSRSDDSRLDLEALTSQVTAAAAGDLADAMAGLQKSLGVPDRPPEAWLQGAYLADAGDYPEVRDYWKRYGTYVASVRSVEGELFRGFVQSRVLRMRLDTTEAAGLSARILERYEGLSEKRDLLYDDLSALSSQAVALHDTLAAHEDEISYQPFEGRQLSRDPVIEAVPDNPALAEKIWGQMDRIFKLLDRIQGIRPVTTLRLQEALLGQLQVPGSTD